MLAVLTELIARFFSAITRYEWDFDFALLEHLKDLIFFN
ncbi:MAG: hypothetical protein BWY37_00222 [Firmicutes bacterium ADurb.Bin262]|nr:MAG: hypothetical protein BWY37_00222 [Firmicutes bacterium ADurb.Bin262]